MSDDTADWLANDRRTEQILSAVFKTEEAALAAIAQTHPCPVCGMRSGYHAANVVHKSPRGR